MKSLFVVTLIFGFLTLGLCQNGLYCWVGYANNGNLRGGPIPCDGGTCLHVNGTYGQKVDIFACEPLGLCSSTGHLNFVGLDGYCCNATNNCNANGFTIPPQPTPTPALPSPIVCNEGIYINNTALSTPKQKLCYGNCASVTGNLGVTNFTVATCDPLTLCDNLDLVNSCHQMPANVISGCCCNTNLCIDPVANVQPTPAPPPPGSIKCFIGLQMDSQTPVGAETYCPGMCHSTSTIIGNSNYTVYACDRYQICEMFGIRPNRCGSEEGALQSCCCDSDNCNTPTVGNFTAPTVDPNPPMQAESCFTGFQTTNIGPLGRSAKCFGDCVTYTTRGLKIFGCDPISVCEQLGAKNGTKPFGALSVSCCSTRNCNYQPTNTTTSCYNGITINMPGHNVSYSKAQSLPCAGRCATFSVAYKHLNVDVYTCDPYNICAINSSDILKVNCCDTPNCNMNPTIPVTTVAPMGRNISCFQGFQLRRGFPFGNRMSCDGACARVHIGEDTIYTCDPGDTCGDFGVNGCNMLFDGLTVCCCKGDSCNEPERPIQPAIKQNLNCFIGYGIGSYVSGGQLPCSGMCGKLTTNINSTEIDAYLCLDRPICEDRAAYERCGRVQTDMSVKMCCCGGYDHCNYEPLNGTVLPPPSAGSNITCPQALYVNGQNLYNTGSTVATCPNSCGLIQFNTTFMHRIVNFAYYGCDPSAFCNQFSTVNSCGSLGNSISGCCCDSDMCMNPLVGRMIPSTGAGLSCWVGYNYNNTLVGGSVPCQGTCVHVNGTYSNQTVDVFACEPAGLCSDGGHLTLPGLDGWCCQDSNNCNAAGYAIPPPPSPAPSLPPPIICNEGLYMNNKSISQTAQKLCYGKCASVSLAMKSNTTFTVATCDPLTLCNRLNLSNSCHVMPQKILSGCCCDSNLCIDPTNNLLPSGPPPVSANLSCWVGYNYNNALVGGSVPCQGSCVHVNGTYSNQIVDVFACEPVGICTVGNHLNLTGVDAWCCQDSNNCNAAGYTIPPPPSPAPSLPPPIICNEGLYMNNKSVSQTAQKLCYGKCASVSFAVNSNTTFTVATCDPLTLCNRLNLSNSCHVMPQQILSGCCCDSNLCIDPTNNLLPSGPPPASANLSCWVGYNYNNALVGGSVPCQGTCVHVNGTYSNQTVDVFACEPAGICSDGSHLTLPGLDGWCCQDSDNCNAANYTIPPPPSPAPSLPPPIICNEGLYMNNKSVSQTAQKLCYGKCASVSLAMNSNTTFTVATCDPLTLCNRLNLSNSCHVMPQQILSGCCCDSNLCIDPTNNLLPSGPPPASADLSCWVGYYYNNILKGGSVPCSMGTCIHMNGTYSNQTVDVFACEPAGICTAGNHLNLPGVDAWCCQDSNNCNAAGYTIPPPTTPLSNTTMDPIICNEGIYKNNANISTTSKKLCYGECASVSFAMNNSTTLTVATCDPLTLCQNLDLTNDCHAMTQKILSGCCCDSNYCIDPIKGLGISGTTAGPPAPTSPKSSATSYTLSVILLFTVSLLFL